MNSENAMPATCFGKIPSRGDFVRGTGQYQLITLLDRWVSRAMEALSEDSRWKIAYDGGSAVDFLFAGASRRISVVGHLRPSSDSSGRRFPLITAAMIERDDSLMFRCGPSGLQQSYAALARIAESGTAGAEASQLLGELDDVNCAADFNSAISTDPLGHFVRQTTLESLAEMLALNNGSEALRRIILAVGLLMCPVLGQGAVHIDKDLVLPLPAGDRYRHHVAGLWLYLTSAFLRRTTVELQVLIERRIEHPHLILGFNGDSPSPLLSTLTPEAMAEHRILLIDPEWIEEQTEITRDYGIAKLSSYLAQPAITLEQVVTTFREVFLGE
ncbi:MAG: type VI secretion system-associated protein TagF [Azoarcus sp.]|jgi:type VI secretion system protein ImpM|nr:type VI secretion system-associated protein TagF [Azoarcus sp.]